MPIEMLMIYVGGGILITLMEIQTVWVELRFWRKESIEILMVLIKFMMVNMSMVILAVLIRNVYDG